MNQVSLELRERSAQTNEPKVLTQGMIHNQNYLQTYFRRSKNALLYVCCVPVKWHHTCQEIQSLLTNILNFVGLTAGHKTSLASLHVCRKVQISTSHFHTSFDVAKPCLVTSKSCEVTRGKTHFWVLQMHAQFCGFKMPIFVLERLIGLVGKTLVRSRPKCCQHLSI